MKAVILAGGFGTRLNEETQLRPKPLVEIGGMPILWHIMKIYSTYGVNQFVVCLGYKGHMIKDYFLDYLQHRSNLTIDLKKNKVTVHPAHVEPWTIELIDTGTETLTAGRLLRVRDCLDAQTFHMTYGDGVANIDIAKLEEFHAAHGRLATLTAVQPPPRFGNLKLGDAQNILSFQEKSMADAGLVNGGFFVLNDKALDYIDSDQFMWENEPVRKLSAAGELFAFKHDGFWSPMDTIRDKEVLEKLWATGNAPWKVWEKNLKSLPKAG